MRTLQLSIIVIICITLGTVSTLPSSFSQTQSSLEEQLKQAIQNIQPAKMVDSVVIPPLQQFKQNFDFSQIQCKDGLQYMIKSSNNLPACVKPSSIEKLLLRKWGSIPANTPNHFSLNVVKPELIVIEKNELKEITVIVPESFVAKIVRMELNFVSFQDEFSNEIMMPIDGFKENERVVNVGIQDLRNSENGSQNKIVLPISASNDTKKGTYNLELILSIGSSKLTDSFKIKVQ